MRLLKSMFWKLAPARLRYRPVPPYASLSYSQEGEDRILEQLFEHKTSGFYVDVGAHHPQKFSNTYVFYLKGWRGINIDARPGSMHEFTELRPRDVNLEAAISDKEEVLTYYQFNDSPLNGFDQKMARSMDGFAHFKITGTVEIRTSTLAQVLDKHMPPNQAIDFLSIDVEGLDEQVLRSNNWTKYRPVVILAEEVGTNTFRGALESRIVRFLDGHGYDLVAKTFNTFIFRTRTNPL